MSNMISYSNDNDNKNDYQLENLLYCSYCTEYFFMGLFN